MKRSDALPSASRSLQAEVGVTEFSAVPAYNPYFVSTVGRDEEMIREYIRNQGKEDQRLDQMNLWR